MEKGLWNHCVCCTVKPVLRGQLANLNHEQLLPHSEMSACEKMYCISHILMCISHILKVQSKATLYLISWNSFPYICGTPSAMHVNVQCLALVIFTDHVHSTRDHAPPPSRTRPSWGLGDGEGERVGWVPWPGDPTPSPPPQLVWSRGRGRYCLVMLMGSCL